MLSLLDPCWPFWFPICLLNLKAARVPISTEQLPRPHGSRSVRKTSPSPLSNVWLALNDIRRDLEMPGCDQDSRENIVGEHYAPSPSPPASPLQFHPSPPLCCTCKERWRTFRWDVVGDASSNYSLVAEVSASLYWSVTSRDVRSLQVSLERPKWAFARKKNPVGLNIMHLRLIFTKTLESSLK